MTDPIADYLTRLRNAIKANHRIVEVPGSGIKKNITKVLHEKGYIQNYKFEDTDNGQGLIKIALKYKKTSREYWLRKSPFFRYHNPEKLAMGTC